MTSLASLLLQAAISLLLLVQANPNLNASLREQAITIANQAIQVATHTSGGAQTTTSNTVPFITILSPNGGEWVGAWQSYEVRWISTGPDAIQPVEINLERKLPTDTQFWNIRTIASNQPGSGSYVWKVTEADVNNSTGAQYKILIGRNLAKGTGPVDESDGSFTIRTTTY